METQTLPIDRPRPLKVFLCYAYHDKDIVRETYKKLVDLGHDVWLDFERLNGGQQWENEIKKAIANADIVLVCITKHSTAHTGYVQKEIKFALDCAVERPEDVIYLIPARLEECYTPNVLKNYQWVDLFEIQGWDVLIKTLQIRQSQLFGTTYKNDENPQNKFQQSDLINELQGIQDTSFKKKTFWDFFSLYQTSRIAGELTNNVSNILRDLLRNYPGDVEKIAASQIKLLTNYYSLVLNQAQRSFAWALVWATVGILVFIASGAFLFANQSPNIAVIGSIGGAIVEVISGINFYLYNKASAQLSDFHARLDATQKVLLSNAIAEKLEGELKQKTRSYLSLKFAGIDVTPEFLKKELVMSANVRIMHIAFNPEGKDVTHEYVKIENIGSGLADMTDWVLQDNAGHKFKFPMFILKPSSSVLVWTKGGKNTPSNLFLKRKRAIWNNSSDCAYLKNNEGKLIDIYYYSNNKATESVLA